MDEDDYTYANGKCFTTEEEEEYKKKYFEFTAFTARWQIDYKITLNKSEDWY